MQSSLAERKPRRIAEPFIPALVSLFLAAYIAWAACPIPPRSLASYILLRLAQAISVGGLAAIYVAVTVLVGFTLLLTWYAILRIIGLSTGVGRRRVLLQTSAAASCIPPLLIVAGRASVWLSAGFSILITLCLVEIFAHNRRHRSSPHRHNQSHAMFFVENLQPWWRRFSVALAASAAAQLGLVTGTLNLQPAAALLLSVSAALILWQLALKSKFHFGSPARVFLIATMAVVITAAGLLQYFMMMRAGEQVPFATALMRLLLGTEMPDRVQTASGHISNGEMRASNEARIDPGYAGVILRPEDEPKAIFLAPPPDWLSHRPNLNRTAPLIIQFSGVYWFFKPPNIRPPRHSFETRGTPAKVSLRSSDRYPLLMEAHQNLGGFMNMNCCAEIQIVISNADPHPETVALELRLINTRYRSGRFQSVGGKVIPSKTPAESASNVPLEQVVTFQIPHTSAIRTFDEIAILFHLDPRREGKSARMAIERFVLIPKS